MLFVQARDLAFALLQYVLSIKDGTPEYNVYNTRHCRESGISPPPLYQQKAKCFNRRCRIYSGFHLLLAH